MVKNFLLLSLSDRKAQKLAHVLNNDTGKRILDYLSEKDGTESEIAAALDIPLPTVHYNLKQLMEAKLVDWKHYHYSEKGKEVKHYTLANKYIIIAPKDEKKSFAEKLKQFLPITLIGVGAAAVMEFMARSQQVVQPMMMPAERAVPAAAPMAADMAEDESAVVAAKTFEVIEPIIEQTPLLADNTIIFLVGFFSCIFLLLATMYIRYRVQK